MAAKVANNPVAQMAAGFVPGAGTALGAVGMAADMVNTAVSVAEHAGGAVEAAQNGNLAGVVSSGVNVASAVGLGDMAEQAGELAAAHGVVDVLVEAGVNGSDVVARGAEARVGVAAVVEEGVAG